MSNSDNSSFNETDEFSEDIIQNNAVQSLFIMLYTAIFVLGIFGNALVCYVVLRNKTMQTVTNIFITNLALSDILLCVLAVPFTPLYTFLGTWVFGSAICHLVSVSQGISVYISTLTLTSIAIDRYFVIIYPFRPRMKLNTCIFIILAIWMFSILVTLPYGIYMQHIILGNATYGNETRVCVEEWPETHHKQVFSCFTTAMQFVIPFFLIAYCYICVSKKLNERAKSMPGCKSSKKEEADRERKKRTNRMLIGMVIIFLVSWLPLNAFNIVSDFSTAFSDWRLHLLCFFAVHLIAMSSTCYNPFLYAWLNENFRKEFKDVLPCFDTNETATVNYRSGRTCHETQQTLLPTSHHVTSIRERKTAPLKPDGVADVENSAVQNTAAIYDASAETVRLKLITDEDPPPYDTVNGED